MRRGRRNGNRNALHANAKALQALLHSWASKVKGLKMKFYIPMAMIAAFGLMAFSCEGKSPVVHMCKTYEDQAACWNDEACEWKAEAFPNSGRCKAK